MQQKGGYCHVMKREIVQINVFLVVEMLCNL